MKVERHYTRFLEDKKRFENDAQDQITNLESDLYDRWIRNELRTLGTNVNSSFNRICKLLLFCPDEGSKLVSDLLFHWKIMAQNYYALAYSIGEEIELKFKGTRIKSVGKRQALYTSYPSWSKAFFVFTFLRNRVGQSIMLSVKMEHFQYSEVEDFKLNLIIVEIFQALTKKGEGLDFLFTEARKWSRPEMQKSEIRNTYVQHILVPFIDCLEVLLLKDEEMFNERLHRALLKHKEFYGSEDLCDDYDGDIGNTLKLGYDFLSDEL